MASGATFFRPSLTPTKTFLSFPASKACFFLPASKCRQEILGGEVEGDWGWFGQREGYNLKLANDLQ